VAHVRHDLRGKSLGAPLSFSVFAVSREPGIASLRAPGILRVNFLGQMSKGMSWPSRVRRALARGASTTTPDVGPAEARVDAAERGVATGWLHSA
jgi:hypothetical protein